MIMSVDQSRIRENNNNSTFLRDYLEGFIVRDTDRRQVDRIIAESNAAKRLRCYFKNDILSGKTESCCVELTILFNVLEGFVLVPIELGNMKELAEEHLNTRLRSIEMLEEVLESVEVKSFIFG